MNYKKLLLAGILFMVAFGAMPQTDSLLVKRNEFLLQQNENILQEYKEYRTAIEKQSQSHLNTFECIYNTFNWFVGIIGALAIFILTFLGLRTRKEMKKEMEININTIKEDVLIKIAEECQKDPTALKELIDERISDIYLKKKAKLCIYYHKDDTHKKNEVELQLKTFGIRKLSSIEINSSTAYEKLKFDEENHNVFFILDPEGNKIRDNIESVLQPVKSGFFYLGEPKFDSEDIVPIKNYCNSNSTLYQNLMDLLRYLEFKKIL